MLVMETLMEYFRELDITRSGRGEIWFMPVEVYFQDYSFETKLRDFSVSHTWK